MTKRILMISNLWPPVVIGGAELYASALAERLRERRWEVGVVTCGVDSPDVVEKVPSFPYRVDQFGVQSSARRAVFHLADFHRRRTATSIGQAIESFAPDVVHSHAIAGLSVTALTTPNALGVPHVHTAHDYWLLCRRSTMMDRNGEFCDGLCRSCAARMSIHEQLLRRHRPDVVLAISHAVAAEHERIRWARGRVRVVHHAVPDVDPLPERPPRSPVVFGYLGRLNENKGVRTLVRAIAGLGDGGRLVVAGEGPLRATLEKEASQGVEFLGWVDETAKRSFFAMIDCLVVPSEWREPAGLVVNEARAYGLPVIAARVGGIPELLPEASRPLLFEPGDERQLLSRLEAFADDPSAYRERGFADDLGWTAHVDAVEAAYSDAIRAHSNEPGPRRPSV